MLVNVNLISVDSSSDRHFEQFLQPDEDLQTTVRLTICLYICKKEEVKKNHILISDAAFLSGDW